ncbi:MAG TPA: DUF4350 domain-containing protein [Thermoanaerobaculia bacterium]|nr:DUF4350 domain-containing protein [Thermoanaerobaculia bacterium]
MRGRWVPVALAAGLFFAGAWFLVAPERTARQAFPPGSVYSAADDGLSLAYEYLVRRRTAATLHRPLDLRSVEPDAVVFRVRPLLPPDAAAPFAEERPARGAALAGLLGAEEEEWLASGGRLVLAVAAPYGGLGVRSTAKAKPEAEPPARPVRKVFPLWPAVERLRPPTARVLAAPGLPLGHALFALGGEEVASRRSVGRGELIALAAPEVFENAHLGRADHLRLLEELAGSGRPVYFDERAHALGQERGVRALLLGWGLGPALGLGALAALAAFWRGRARLGPPEPEPPDRRREAVDLVDSLAQLYARALSRREALALYRRALGGAVGLRTGLRGAALEARVYALTGDAGEAAATGREGKRMADLKPWEFKDGLERLNRAFEGVEHA